MRKGCTEQLKWCWRSIASLQCWVTGNNSMLAWVFILRPLCVAQSEADLEKQSVWRLNISIPIQLELENIDGFGKDWASLHSSRLWQVLISSTMRSNWISCSFKCYIQDYLAIALLCQQYTTYLLLARNWKEVGSCQALSREFPAVSCSCFSAAALGSRSKRCWL